jgi:hypothetical protein
MKLSMAVAALIALTVIVAGCGGSEPAASAGTDTAYVASICKAGLAFVGNMRATEERVLRETKDPNSPDALKTAAIAMAGPFETLTSAVKQANPPADLRANHARLIANLESAIAKLKTGDVKALDGVEINAAPEDAIDRLNAIAATNADCVTAKFSFGD